MSEAGGICVVVPTLNEAAAIDRVLTELAAGLPIGRRAEIVVADGGSVDDTCERVAAFAARDPRIRLIANPARLQSAAINLVARSVAGWASILVRADAHAEYPPSFVANIVTALERTGAESLVVPMDSIGVGCTARAIAWVSDSLVGSGGSAHRGGRASGYVDHGHHAGWRLEAFLGNDGYDESFSHNEDAEFDCRLRRRGGRVWLDADIRLRYCVRPTLVGLWRQYRNYGRGRSRTVRRHPDTMRARQLAVPTFVGANILALLMALAWPVALLLPIAYLLVLAAVSAMIAARHRSSCGLLGGAVALVMHVAWATGFAEGMVLIRERRWTQSASIDRFEPAINPQSLSTTEHSGPERTSHG